MSDLLKLAQQAGFKVWPDGRVTAADNGVSGSATQSLAEFARLVLAAAPSPAIAATDDVICEALSSKGSK